MKEYIKAGAATPGCRSAHLPKTPQPFWSWPPGTPTALCWFSRTVHHRLHLRRPVRPELAAGAGPGGNRGSGGPAAPGGLYRSGSGGTACGRRQPAVQLRRLFAGAKSLPSAPSGICPTTMNSTSAAGSRPPRPAAATAWLCPMPPEIWWRSPSEKIFWYAAPTAGW